MVGVHEAVGGISFKSAVSFRLCKRDFQTLHDSNHTRKVIIFFFF